MSDFSTAF